MTISAIPRRRAAVLATLLGATVALTACGSDDSDDSSSGSGAEGYPVTVDSEYGEFTLDEEPERIVVIGGDYLDLLASIDEQPAAFSGYGDPDEETLLANYPWLADLYTGEFDATLVTAEYKADPEAIARHEPDLIIGSPYYIDEQLHEQLSAVAPTYVTFTSADRDWTDVLTDLGALTGEADAAAEVIAGVESAFDEARGQLTALEGRTVTFADESSGALRLLSSGSWVADLGLTPAANQPGVGSPFVELSAENLDQLDGDIAFLVTYDEEGRAALEGDPRFADLPSVANDSAFFIERPVADAGLGAGPASLEWLLEQVVPLLADSPLNAAGQ